MICNNCKQEGGDGLFCEHCGTRMANDSEIMSSVCEKPNIVKKVMGLGAVILLVLSMFLPFLKVNISEDAASMMKMFGVEEKYTSYSVKNIFMQENWPWFLLVISVVILALAGLMAWKMIRGTTVLALIGAFPLHMMYIVWLDIPYKAMYHISIGFVLPFIAYILLLIAACQPKELRY